MNRWKPENENAYFCIFRRKDHARIYKHALSEYVILSPETEINGEKHENKIVFIYRTWRKVIVHRPCVCSLFIILDCSTYSTFWTLFYIFFKIISVSLSASVYRNAEQRCELRVPPYLLVRQPSKAISDWITAPSSLQEQHTSHGSKSIGEMQCGVPLKVRNPCLRSRIQKDGTGIREVVYCGVHERCPAIHIQAVHVRISLDWAMKRIRRYGEKRKSYVKRRRRKEK